MVPIGVAMVWGAYTVGIWGYCLVRGYDVTFMQMFKGFWPGKAGTAAQQALQKLGSAPVPKVP